MGEGKKVFWGVEHFSYDSSGRLTSANYIVLSRKSMHPGYEHNCSYVYDDYGRLTMELRGYRETEFIYNEKSELSYLLVHEHEFAKREFKDFYTIIVK